MTKSLSTEARSALLLLFLVSFFNYMDRYVLSVLLPSIKADLALSDTQFGAVGTAFTISYVLLGIPFARMADQHNRKYVITAAVTIWSVMTAACGLAQNFSQLAIARGFCWCWRGRCHTAITFHYLGLFSSQLSCQSHCSFLAGRARGHHGGFYFRKLAG